MEYLDNKKNRWFDNELKKELNNIRPALSEIEIYANLVGILFMNGIETLYRLCIKLTKII